MASPLVHRSEREQMDLTAHFRRGSTWICLSAALWASEKMSFNEVNLIAQFYGAGPEPQSLPTSERSDSMPESAQRAELSCFQVRMLYVPGVT